MKNWLSQLRILLLMIILLAGCRTSNDISTLLAKPNDFPGQWEWTGSGSEEAGEEIFADTQQVYEWRSRRLSGSPESEKWLINIVHLVSISEDQLLLDELVQQVTDSWASQENSDYQLDFEGLDDNTIYWTCRVEETIVSSCRVLIGHSGFNSTLAFFFPTGSEPEFVEPMIESVVLATEARAQNVALPANNPSQ
ncbi:MAG: hypothetical protein IT327_24695 [Anaerolineae bacterium]|nr:hypothetical protein [Anaerolineae bacterium]